MEAIQAFGRFGLAMSLFGLEQVERLLGRAEGRPDTAFDAVSARVVARLAGLGGVFRAGDRLQSAFVDAAFATLPPLAARGPLVAGLALAEDWARLARWLPGQDIAFGELARKLRAFASFQDALARQGESGDDLAGALSRAPAAGPWTSLWLAEGLAFAAFRAKETPTGLLKHDQLAALPEGILVAAHAGAGEAMAMAELAPPVASDEVRTRLARYLARARAEARPGYFGATLEPLGLVARTLLATRLDELHGALSEVDPALLPYFWHGVGRGLYFAPSDNLRPWWAPGLSLAKARSEPPGPAERAGAISGLAWAVTLVNVGAPEAVARWVLRARDEDEAAFADGVRGAALVWSTSAGADEPCVRRLLAHVPGRPGSAAVERWTRWVAGPVAEAAAAAGRLSREQGLGEILRFGGAAELGATKGAGA